MFVRKKPESLHLKFRDFDLIVLMHADDFFSFPLMSVDELRYFDILMIGIYLSMLMIKKL